MKRPTPINRNLALLAGVLSLSIALPAWAAGNLSVAEAANCVGRVCCIEGTVAKVATTWDNATVLNIGQPGQNQSFTVVIASDAGLQFRDIQVYHGQKVRITGLVKMHQGHLQAVLVHPSQLALAD